MTDLITSWLRARAERKGPTARAVPGRPEQRQLNVASKMVPPPAQPPAEARTVFAVTEGEYSDFRYKAIFEDRDDADQARANDLGDDVHEIRYYPRGAPLPDKVVVWIAGAEVSDDGSFWCAAAEPRVWLSEIRWTCSDDVPDLTRPDVHLIRTGLGSTNIRVEAATGEAALKACADRTAKLRAEILGGHHG